MTESLMGKMIEPFQTLPHAPQKSPTRPSGRSVPGIISRPTKRAVRSVDLKWRRNLKHSPAKTRDRKWRVQPFVQKAKVILAFATMGTQTPCKGALYFYLHLKVMSILLELTGSPPRRRLGCDQSRVEAVSPARWRRSGGARLWRGRRYLPVPDARIVALAGRLKSDSLLRRTPVIKFRKRSGLTAR
jgi:hypothetical protein